MFWAVYCYAARVKFPKVYAIADRTCFAHSMALFAFVEELLAAGVTLIQYRNK